MLNLKITMGTDYQLYLSAENMNDLVDKIIEWQLWENQPLELFQKKGTLEENKNSNWYYFKK
jgi:hypothetical protein